MNDVTAVIPVRGGSQGVVGKNLRLLAGRPLLWYAVDSASRAARITRVIVSTEDPQIAEYASATDAEVVIHPAELSGPESPTFPVIRWNLDKLRSESKVPSLLVVLRATSPLRTSDDIDSAIALLEENAAADSVVSVTTAVGIHPIRLKRILPDGRLVDGFGSEGGYPRRRQELESLYLRNGAVYATRPHVVEGGRLWGDHCLAYVMPEDRSININTEFQFRVAELCLQHPVE